MDKNYELELYRLIMNPDEDNTGISYVDEFGWVSDTEFFVWINSICFPDFLSRINDIFGYTLFDDGGIEARIGTDYVCINLEDFAWKYDIDLERIFPKDKYRH